MLLYFETTLYLSNNLLIFRVCLDFGVKTSKPKLKLYREIYLNFYNCKKAIELCSSLANTYKNLKLLILSWLTIKCGLYKYSYKLPKGR